MLGDFLGAVGQAPRKTRIVGLANLNPASFEKYLSFCLELRLVEARPDGYHLTPKAAAARSALEEIVTKSGEVDRAVGALQHALGHGRDAGDGALTLRWVSRLAWTEVLASKTTGKLALSGVHRVSAALAALVDETEADWGSVPSPQAGERPSIGHSGGGRDVGAARAARSRVERPRGGQR